MIIGTFTKKEGNYHGSITAIGAVLPKVAFEALEAATKGPNFRITAQGAELGAAWNKVSEKSGKAYLSVSFRSPFLPAQVYGALVDSDEAGKFNLVWTEPKPKSE